VLLQGGVMATHDEETRKFFKHSSVICVLSPRYASNKLSIFQTTGKFWAEIYGSLSLYGLHLRLVCIGIGIRNGIQKIIS